MTSPFDAAAWLRDFEAVGGWYVIGAEGRLTCGWLVCGQSGEQLTEARRLWHVMADNPGFDDAVAQVIDERAKRREMVA